MDLKGHRLTHVEGLDEFVSLSSLQLEENAFESFQPAERLESLKYLKLSGNRLTSVDVTSCPNLRLLYPDRNRLGSVSGL